MFSHGLSLSSNKLSQLDWTVKSVLVSGITETFWTMYLTTGAPSKATVQHFAGIRRITMPKFVRCISTLYYRLRTIML